MFEGTGVTPFAGPRVADESPRVADLFPNRCLFLLFLDYGCLGGAEASAHRESTKRRDRTLRRHLTKLVLLHKDHSAAERPTRRRKAYTVLRQTQSEDATCQEKDKREKKRREGRGKGKR